jgi:hypothetical protein
MPLIARTASCPAIVVLFLFILLSYTDLALAASSFHHKLTGHQAAANKAFHDNLLAQLAASKQQKTNFDNVPENRLVLSNEVSPLDAATTPTLESFAADASPTFQIYLNSTLPTDPAPPAACATALMATINCNETITLMGYVSFAVHTLVYLILQCFQDQSIRTYQRSPHRLHLYMHVFTCHIPSQCRLVLQNYMITSSNVTYPPTYIVDTIAGPYKAQCLQDPTTSQLCSPLLSSFNSSGSLLSLPTSELCTFCTLETLNVTLSNPATFSIPLLDILSSAVQACGP